MDRHPLRQADLSRPDERFGRDRPVTPSHGPGGLLGQLRRFLNPSGGQRPPRAGDPHDHFPFFPLFVWLAVQFIALIVGAFDVAWSADYAAPAHLQGLPVMLVPQLVAATLLAPWDDWRRGALAMALTLWPFAWAAGFLSGTAPEAVAIGAFYVSTWILALAVLHGPKSHPLLPTVATLTVLLVLSDPIGGYLSREFSGRELPEFGPISAVFRLVEGDGSWRVALAPLGILLAAGLLRRYPQRPV